MSFTYIQGTGHTSTSTAFTSLFNGPVTSGDLIVMGSYCSNALGASLSSIADNYGNSVKQAVNMVNTGTQDQLFIHYIIAPSNMNNYGFTYNWSSNPFAGYTVNEYSMPSNTVVAVYAASNTGNGTIVSTNSLATNGTGISYLLINAQTASTGFLPFALRNLTNSQFSDFDALNTVGTITASGHLAASVAWTALSASFVPIPIVQNIWLDNFTNLSSNGKLMTNRYSDNGASYANWDTSNSIFMQNGSPYSSLGANFGSIISSIALPRNSPMSVTFQYDGNSTATGFIFIGNKATNANNGYVAELQTGTTPALLQFRYILGGFGTTLVSINLNSTPSGIYTLTYVPYGILHSLYVYIAGTGYYNGAQGVWQSAQAPAIRTADNFYTNIGLPTFGVYMQPSWPHAPQIMQLQGGQQIMFAPEIGIQRVYDTFVHINCFEADGGTSPITYVLQRQMTAPVSGNMHTIGYIQPYTPYYDYGVSPSSSYKYQVVATDSSSPANILTSNTVSANTLPATTISAPKVLPGTGTAIINGVPTTDIYGNVFGFTANFIWDEKYQRYFSYPVGGQYPAAGVNCYASEDLMNWTPVSGTFWSHQPGGSTFRCEVIPHATNGQYYGFSQQTGVIYVYQGPTPYGPFNLIVSGILPPGVTAVGDTRAYVDYDGSMWAIGSASNGGITQGCVAQYLPNVTGFVYASGSLINPCEGVAPFRYKRLFCAHVSQITDWAPNGNTMNIWGVQGGGTGQYYQGFNYSNTSIYTTPAQALAAPAGGVSGYGTQYGISGGISYSTQSDYVGRTRGGQYIAVTDRWNANGTESIFTTSQVWMPIVFDTIDQPSIPFVATLVPYAQPQGNAGVHAIGGM